MTVLIIDTDDASYIRDLLEDVRVNQDRLHEAGVCGWDEQAIAAQQRIRDSHEILLDIIGHAVWKQDTQKREIPNPPSAPSWLDSTEASSWESGWSNGYAAALSLET